MYFTHQKKGENTKQIFRVSSNLARCSISLFKNIFTTESHFEKTTDEPLRILVIDFTNCHLDLFKMIQRTRYVIS